MKIGIDLSMVDSRSAGIGHYAESITESLLENDKNNDYILFTQDKSNLSNLLNTLENLNLKKRVVVNEVKGHGVLWIYKVVKILKKDDFDFFLSPSNFLFGVLFSNTVQWIHDLAPVKFPQFFKRNSSLKYKLLLDLLLLKGKYIATISESVKQEIIEYRPSSKNKIIYIGIGIHSWILNKADQKIKEDLSKKFNLPKNFFLCVSTLEPRKNHINTIKGFKNFLDKTNSDYKLVITGKKGWFYEEIFKLVKELSIEDKVIFTDYLNNQELNALYELSNSIVMLSFYEGFGLALIEGLIKGKNLLVSNIPVFNEVLNNDKDRAVFSDPNDLTSIANGFKILTKKDTVSKPYDYSNFTWSLCSKRLRELLAKI